MNQLNFTYKKNTQLVSLLIVSILTLAGAYYFFDALVYSPIRNGSHKNLSYNNHSGDHDQSTVKEYAESFTSEFKTISMSFYFKVNSIGRWNNIFQTAPANDGIRMELAAPATLGLIIKDKKNGVRGFYISRAIERDRQYFIQVSVDLHKRLHVFLDNITVVDVIDQNIDYDISDIAVGSGFSKSRPFDGKLSQFDMQYTLFKKRYKILIGLEMIKIASMVLIVMIPYYILVSYLPD